ncbi:hypothetical protein [Rhodococcus koreensis]
MDTNRRIEAATRLGQAIGRHDFRSVGMSDRQRPRRLPVPTGTSVRDPIGKVAVTRNLESIVLAVADRFGFTYDASMPIPGNSAVRQFRSATVRSIR